MIQPINIEALRAQIRAIDYVRGTPDDVAQWGKDMAESRANLVIEGMNLSGRRGRHVRDDAGRGATPALMPSIILTLYEQGITAPDQADAAP